MGFGSIFSGITRGISSLASGISKAVSNSAILKQGGWKGILSGGLKQFAISFIASTVFSFVYQKLAGKPKMPDIGTGNFSSQATAQKQLIRSPVAVRSIVYGTIKKSGAIVHAETQNNNQDLYLVIALTGHEVQSIGSIFFNDTEITTSQLDSSGNVTSGTFSGKAQIVKHLGEPDQTVDTLLDNASTVWTSAHRLRNIAYVVVKLNYDVDTYPNGIPNISVIIEGKKIYNVATTATEFSNNPANIIYDYLTSATGLNADTTEIDIASFQQAYADCNDSITITGGTQNRYTCNGVITTDRKPVEVLEDLLTSCAGTLTYVQGKFKLKVGKAVSSVRDITDTDMAGEIKIATRPKRSALYNKVKGVFVDSTTDYTLKEFNTQESSTFASSDGEIITNEIELPFTTDPVMAQRLALIVLKQSRQMMTLDLILKPKHLDLGVGDVVAITNSKLGFTNKKFFIVNYQLNTDCSINVILQEYADAVFNFNASTEQVTLQTASAISLPNPNSVTAPTNLVIGDELRISNEGIVTSVITVTATQSTDAFVGRYECRFKKTTDTDYTFVGITTFPKFDIHGVLDGVTYDVQLRAISSIGVKSSYVSGQHTVVGSLSPPSNVTDFSCNIIGKEAHLSWEAVLDKDLSFYQVRYSNLTEGATWQNSVSLVEKVSRPATSIVVPARTGSYLIKSSDKSGNFCLQETIVSTNVSQIGNFNAVVTQTENPSFTGNKNNITLANDALRLTNISATTGIYDFSQVIDIGVIHTARVTASLSQFSEDPTDLFDLGRGFSLVDSATGSFDGNAPQNENAHLEISTSNDNVNFTNFRNFVIGDFTFRFCKFRLVFISRDNLTTPVVSALAITIDVEDEIQSDNNIISGTSTKTVTFPKPFYSTNYSLGITAENLLANERFVLQNKTTTGFNITFKDSTDSNVSRQFDYIAKGF